MKKEAAVTFLEFVCEKLMGAPARCRGNGESGWPCPRCDHHSFHTRPHLPDEKDRVKCFRCDLWGDEYDILRQCRPQLFYPQQQALLAAWRKEFAARENSSAGTIPFRGAGSKPAIVMRVYDRHPSEDEFSAEADAAIGELLTFIAACGIRLSAAVALCEKALSVCAGHVLHPQGLAGRCGFVRWVHETDTAHMAACTDADCEWRCCRLARGWTEEEINADLAMASRNRMA